MKVWIFVEGRSDVRALEALWGVGSTPLEERVRGFNSFRRMRFPLSTIYENISTTHLISHIEERMIKKIRINNVATFGPTPEELDELKKINFIYGANATGKTTISRIIADVDAPMHSESELTWVSRTAIETLVYNRDFVDRNFNQPPQLQGIFTLGEQDKETEDRIAAVKEDLSEINDTIAALENSLHGPDKEGGKHADSKQIEREFEEQCWEIKREHDAEFMGAFSGYRGSKKDFKKKILAESLVNSTDLVPLDTLTENAKTVFAGNLQEQTAVRPPDWRSLIRHERNPFLRKSVIGKSDVDIAALIHKLGNSDWVKEGRSFYDPKERICPFCQQETHVSLEESLSAYFDETFEADANSIERLCIEYKRDSERLRHDLNAILDHPPDDLDTEKLQNQVDIFEYKIRLNLQQIEEKIREPSRSIELDSLTEVSTEISGLLEATNAKIREHNHLVNNAHTERMKLTDQVWRYLLECKIKNQLVKYNSVKNSIHNAIASLNEEIIEKNTMKSKKEKELNALEKETTSIQPTIGEINSILRSYGFENFYLAKSNRERFYEIRRSDGTSAKETLSEGERSFISFLYFYHLLKGSTRESGLTSDRVVVIDDPVSSLDSNVLFIVSCLIKELFSDLRENVGPIKQVFVLTHNAYFHKEVTFDRRRRDGRRLSHETFWTVRKSGLHSTIESHKTNPIKSTYESLWMEAKRADTNGLFLQNTLRRILEHYFKILGNVDFDEICAKFVGEKKLVCKSLFSWLHEGSHSAYDDPHYSPDGTVSESYLTVFKDIFCHTGNGAHYGMMMGDDPHEQ